MVKVTFLWPRRRPALLTQGCGRTRTHIHFLTFVILMRPWNKKQSEAWSERGQRTAPGQASPFSRWVTLALQHFLICRSTDGQPGRNGQRQQCTTIIFHSTLCYRLTLTGEDTNGCSLLLVSAHWPLSLSEDIKSTAGPSDCHWTVASV